MKKRVETKIVSILFFALVIMVTLSACSSGKETGTLINDGLTDSSKGQKPVKLRIVWWGSQTRHEPTLKALELYTKKNPHVTFDPEFSGNDGYADKLATQAASKNAPDIFQLDLKYFAEYASRNQLAELSTGIRLQNIDVALLETGKYRNKQYAIPLGNNATAMVYNKNVVDKLGIKPPSNDWTWEEYFQFGIDAKAKLADNKYALLDSTSDYDMYTHYQLSKGQGAPITDDGKFNINKETWLEFINKYAALRAKGVVPPAEITATDIEYDAKLDLLHNDKVLIRRSLGAIFTGYDSLKPGVYQLVKVPKGGQAGGFLKPSMFWAVSADTKHAEEATKFIDWFINDEEAADILTTTRGVPVSSTILEHLRPQLKNADMQQVELNKNVAPDAQKYSQGAKGWSNYTEKDYKDIGEQVIFGKISPEAAYDVLIKKAKDYE
ncbi:ABC transporter substrate-binding protein [Bacillus sp. FJAT-26390]|uniref:ABC transporter substrate-binding protein n=1 Tax=Bacillus sp. FJAT-26390 TaxID=1743142 RepID=UPI0009E3DA96|nr:extracellular solute-binding protein [Bacillus sp. FJAT-26390]